MQIESHATPPSSSPQLRYAALHRAIERGLASDEVWRELAEVCLHLGHRDESARSVQQIENVTLRNAMASRLQRLGLRHETRMHVRGHATAPAASHAGSTGHGDDEVLPGRTKEHLSDALQFLLLQHMPLLALATTMSFPLLVGLGGFLTAGGSFLLLAGIAALPGLAVLSLVGAMGRRILRSSFEGSNDVPAVGDLGRLLDDAQRFVVDAALVLGSFLAPPIVAMLLGAPLNTSLPGLVVGGLFAPMAWALRNLRGDFTSLSPVLLMRAVAKAPVQYVALALVCWGLFAPAALTTWLVAARPVWVQIAVIGPLTVLPFFVSSRLLGTWFETRRRRFGALLVGSDRAAAAGTRQHASESHGEKAAAKPAPAARPAARPAAEKPAAASPNLPPRPDALRYYEARDVHESRRAKAPQSARRDAAEPRAKTTQSSQPAGPQPAQPKAAQPKAAQPRQPQQPQAQPQPGPTTPRRQIEGRSPRRGPADGPDLSHMPGAVVVKGKERARKGAAARPN